MGVDPRIRAAMASPLWPPYVSPLSKKDSWPMPGPYPAHLRFLVLIYQVGDLAKCLFRRLMLGEKEGAGYLADSKLHIADIVTQCKVLCLELGFDYDEIAELGMMHFEETSKELKSGVREA